MASTNVADDFKPQMSYEDFVSQLKEAGFTDKTLVALEEEDINSDAALKILSPEDVEALAKEKGLTIGQKRLLIEFAAKLNPKKDVAGDKRSAPRSRGFGGPGGYGANGGYGGTGGYKTDRSRSPASQQKRMNPDESTCLCVFNLSPMTTEHFIYEFFSRICTVKNVKIIYDKVTGHSRGFAFVYFHEIHHAKYAKEASNGMLIDGQQIRVDFSLTTRSY